MLHNVAATNRTRRLTDGLEPFVNGAVAAALTERSHEVEVDHEIDAFGRGQIIWLCRNIPCQGTTFLQLNNLKAGGSSGKS